MRHAPIHPIVRRVVVLLALLVASVAVAGPAAAADGTRIVVARAPGVSVAEGADARDDAGTRLLHATRLRHVEVDVATHLDAALRTLRADPDVQWAEVDHRRRAFDADPLFASQWGLENTGANADVPAGTPDADMDVPEAWGTATGGGVTVAVVDSGVDAAHPDLAGAIDPGSRDLVGDGGTDVSDANGHGTHVAGIIAARRDNGEGIAGVAPDAKLLVLRALGADGSGYDSDIAEAFDYAADHGARIVNASLGGPGDATILETAIAAHPGTLFVVAAGNDGVNDDRTPTYPCSLPEANVLCVGASNEQDGRASFSNWGRSSVDVFAPGTDIVSTYPPELQTDATGYEFMDGTSMATPMVSGEAALLLQAVPELSTAALKDAILGSVDVGGTGLARSVSGGRANAEAALARATAPAAASTLAPLPTATPAPTASPLPSPAPSASPSPSTSPPPVAPMPQPAGSTAPSSPPNAAPPRAPVTWTSRMSGSRRAGRLRLRVSRHRHRVTAYARAQFASRTHPITLSIERRNHHRHWHRVARRRTRSGHARLKRHLPRGRYRVRVTATGSRTAHRTFRLR